MISETIIDGLRKSFHGSNLPGPSPRASRKMNGHEWHVLQAPRENLGKLACPHLI